MNVSKFRNERLSLSSRALFNFYSIMDNTYSPVVYSYNARPLHFAPPRRCTLFGLLLFITGEIPRIVFPKNTATNHRATPALSLSLSISHSLTHSLTLSPFSVHHPFSFRHLFDRLFHKSLASLAHGRSSSIVSSRFRPANLQRSFLTVIFSLFVSGEQSLCEPALHSSISSSLFLFRLFIFPLSRLFRSSCLISSRLSNNIIIIMHREQAFNSEATAKKACG